MNQELSPAWLIEKLSQFEMKVLCKIQSVFGLRDASLASGERTWSARLVQFVSAVCVFLIALQIREFEAVSANLGAVSFLFGKTFEIAATLLAALALSPARALPKTANLRLIWFTLFGLAIALVNSLPKASALTSSRDTQMAWVVGFIFIFATAILVCLVLDGISRARAVGLRFFQYACACGAAYFLPNFIRFLILQVFILPSAETMTLPFSSAHILVFTIIYVMHEIYVGRSRKHSANNASQMPPAEQSEDIRAESLPGRERVFISHALSPVYFISAFPIPIEALPEYATPLTRNRHEPSIIASWNLFAALLWGICSLGLGRVLASFDQNHEISFSFGLLNYLFFYFYWLAILRVSYAVGLGFGYKLKEPSQFALLASNPIERWKRWNRYFYDWFLLYVFLPLSRKTGRVEIGLLAVFLIDLLLHNVGLINSLVVTETAAPLFDLLKADVIFYAAQGLVLYLNFQSPKLFPTGAKRIGWIGVGATNLIMIGVHTLARFR